MKKTIRLIALSLVLVMSALLFASCGAPNSDPEKALKALKDNDYTAEKIDDSSFTGKAALAALGAVGIDDVDAIVSGSAKIDGEFETITILYFEDKEAANDAWEDAQKYADKEKDDDADKWIVKKSGAMIYFGTENGAKAAQ